MANKYWVGSVSGTTPASGNWNSSTGWRTTSGGLTITTAPGTGDVAVFDNNSFLGAAITVTVSATTTVGSIDASAITTGANGITLAGASALTISGGSSTGSLLNLPSSRFSWTHNGTLTISGSGSVTTNGVSIASNVSVSGGPYLVGNFNGTGTLTLTNGTITVSSYQWVCSTFTATSATTSSISASAGGGITATATSGTVINVTKTLSQLTFPSIKPIFTLSGNGTTSRGITWTGSSWATSTSTMPGLSITNGSDTITITQTASSANYNLYSLNTSTSFTGTLTYASPATTAFSVFGDFTFSGGSFTNFQSSSTVNLYGTNNNFAASANILCNFDPSSVYTQSGNINVYNCNYITGSAFTSGSLTLNNTGTLSGGFNALNGVTLVGNVSVGNASSIIFNNAITTSLTSITKTGSSDSGTFQINNGTYSSSVSFIFNATNYNITFTSCTINGTTTFNAPLNGQLIISNSTFANPLTLTTQSFAPAGTVNIPTSSAITVSNSTSPASYQGNSVTTYTNKFTINLVASATYGVSAYSVDAGNNPDVYLSGSGAATFDDGNTYFDLYCSLFDASAFTGTIVNANTDTLHVKTFSAPTAGSSGPQFPFLYLYSSATGTFSFPSCNLYGFNYNSSNQTISLGSSTIKVDAGGFNASALNAGTSTIIASNGSISVSSGGLNNVVVASGTVTIGCSSIYTLSNSTQPVTVYFSSDVTFTNFSLNGTSGNLVTIRSNVIGVIRSLTKSTPWNLANSFDGGNNSGITFGTTGNNSYLSVSYINGISSYVPVTNGNFFSFF
jgi:hypothetical protein